MNDQTSNPKNTADNTDDEMQSGENDSVVGRYALDGPVHRVAADSRGRTATQADFNKMSRRSLLTGAGVLGAAFLAWNGVPYLRGTEIPVLSTKGFRERELDDRIPGVLRGGHEFNESVWQAIFRDGASAPTFDFDESSMMRENGRHGIGEELDVDTWQMQVLDAQGQLLGTHVVDDLRALPQTEMTVEHKCVEGWAHIVTWGGVPFHEFVAAFYPEQREANFVGLSTPDGEFNVGLEMASMLHPQTMLSLDLQREPLSDQHGAPVRLSTPLKYGTKQIKRIGTIQFSDTQPENDYWTVRGYDWYAAL